MCGKCRKGIRCGMNIRKRIISAVGAFVMIGAVLMASCAFAEMSAVAETSAETKAYDPPDRQILLSMGESPETMFISYSGNTYGPWYVRYAQSPEELQTGRVVKAHRERILGSNWYRYSVKIRRGNGLYYQIGDGVTYDAPKYYETVSAGLTTQFIFIGDIQLESPSRSWKQMIEGAREKKPDFALMGGDMVNVPTDSKQWNSLLNNCQALGELPVMTAAGNHEGVHSNVTYKKIFALPRNGPEGLEENFYYFDYSLCRITVLDSSFMTRDRAETMGERQWAIYEKEIKLWLKDALENNRFWNIVVMHHPPYGMHDDGEISEEMREEWIPIIEACGVDLVLSGHQHLYMRTRPVNGVVYIMGNSGQRISRYYDGRNKPFYAACVYEEEPGYEIVSGSLGELKIIAYNEKGHIVDEAVIKRSILFHIFKFFGGD